ncbi:hypothetical protein L208DRAFT_1221428, partial [Tricholoma matsutake]
LTALRTTHPIIDSEDRVIGLLARRPQGAADWEALCKEAADAIEEARSRCVFAEKQVDHHHRAFPAVPVGIAHGNGTQGPCNLCNGKNTVVLSDLLGRGCFKCIAGY